MGPNVWSARPPIATIGDVLEACARTLRDRDLAQRVTTSLSELSAIGDKYRAAASAQIMHTISKDAYVVSRLSDDELKALYSNQLAKVGRPGRPIYLSLRSGGPHGHCAYCMASAASTLDHVVPQTAVPALAVEPWNLVPACLECNKTLREIFSDLADEQFLHPYFMPEIGRWLHARVNESIPASLEYYADPSPDLGHELCCRIANQFKVLGLARRYSVESAPDVTQLARTLHRQFGGAIDSADAVRDQLVESAYDSSAVDRNWRRAVMYEALAASDWYCSGGYAI